MLMPCLLKFAVIMLLIQLKMLGFFSPTFSQCSSLLHAANDVLLSFSGPRSCAK